MNFRLSNIDSNDQQEPEEAVQNFDEIEDFDFPAPQIRRSESAADDYLNVCA